MGRSKAKPTKRQRVDDEEESAKQAAAIELLKSTPQEVVEQAAADATRLDVEQHWPQLMAVETMAKNDHDFNNGSSSTHDDASRSSKKFISTVPAWSKGLGASRKLDAAHFETLKRLHQQIKTQSPQWTSWSGSPTDPRQRAFVFLPETLGYDPATRQLLDISMPRRVANESVSDSAGDSGKDPQEDTTPPAVSEDEKKPSDNAADSTKGTPKNEEEDERRRNEKATVILETVPEGTKEAIEHVCDLFRECVKESSKDDNQNSQSVSLADFLHYRNLIAAQPNLHNGRELLPMHFDHPLKDGFGVVIVTISMTGSGMILLQDALGCQRLAMPLQAGEAYMLADQARDACVHGVLTDVGQDKRESLNLRFGLHDLPIKDCVDGGVVPASEVLKYWETSSET